jgi:exodeoxyribonuclease VII large subunit
LDNSLLQSLFETEEKQPLSVTELNAQVKSTLERSFNNVWLEAEIQDFSEPNSGHWYFSLHDSSSQIRAACFKGTNWKIRFKPFDGLQVRVRGKISVYAPRGDYQILVDSLEPVGEGAIRIAFEQIKAKLRQEGLFDDEHKRQLPFLPKRVGVVTSPTGAAIFDILNVLTRRTKTVDIVLIPAVVQGESAPESIREGILLANEYNSKVQIEERLDVLIVGRGGGSAEDLSAFNEERLARTIFESDIPIISAVGHEIDWSISDFVADLRAPTPSAAAEIVAESEDALSERIRLLGERANHLAQRRISIESERLRKIRDSGVFQRFPEKIRGLREHLQFLDADLRDHTVEAYKALERRMWKLRQRLSPVKLSADLGARKLRFGLLKQRNESALRKLISVKQESLKIRQAGLDALSPLAVLERGYSITKNAAGKVVSDADSVAVGETLNVVLSKGQLTTKVTNKE